MENCKKWNNFFFQWSLCKFIVFEVLYPQKKKKNPLSIVCFTVQFKVRLVFINNFVIKWEERQLESGSMAGYLRICGKFVLGQAYYVRVISVRVGWFQVSLSTRTEGFGFSKVIVTNDHNITEPSLFNASPVWSVCTNWLMTIEREGEVGGWTFLNAQNP